MKPTPWIAAAFIAPLFAAQQSAPKVAGYESISALEAVSPPSAKPALDASMAALAEAGDGRALAWCLRRPETLGAERTPIAFARLVRDHAAAPWLRQPALDPVSALRRLDRASRRAVIEALGRESPIEPTARALALWLEASALAPSDERDAAQAGAVRARLAELRAVDPDGPWARQAEDLAWRIDHLAPGAPAPELVLRDVDGNELVLEDWLDGDVLIDVWRIDDPERAERTAELAALVERVAAQRPALRLRVLALGLGLDAASFRRELEEFAMPWQTAFEPAAGGPVQQAWHLDGRPTRLWVDAAGRVRAVDGSSAELEALMLAQGAPAHAEPIRPSPNDEAPEAAAPHALRESSR